MSFPLGSGIRVYPASGTTFADVFDNSVASLTCDAGGPATYAPGASDIRKIVMQFNDGNGWQTLPAMNINAVPYAIYANDAMKLGGVSATSFVQYSTLPTCTASESLSYNGASFNCVAAGSAPTNVTSSTVITALGYTPADGASVTALSSSLSSTNANVSAVSSTLSNVSAYAAAVSSTVYSVSSTVSTLENSVSILQTTVASNSAAIATLQSDLSSVSATVNGALIKTNNLSDLTNVSTARTNLGLGTFATANSLDLGSASATGTIAEARLANQSGVTSGTAYTKVTVDGKGRVTSGAQLSASDVTTALGYTPQASGTISGLASLNGSTSQTQTFANGTSGNVPAFVTANGIHTLNIPLASATGSVTAGLISNADYVSFSNKITSSAASIAQVLGYTPANSATVATLQSDLAAASATANNALVKTNNLSDLTNVSTARTNLGLGTFATANSLDLGSASATGIIADARLANQSGVTSGTQYTKVTVDGKGRVTSGAQLSASDVATALGYTPANSSTVVSSQWTTSGTTINYTNGYVGIGTAAPRQILDVAPATGNSILRVTSTNSTAALQLYRNTAGSYSGPVLWANGTDLNFGYDSSENAGPTLMTLKTNGSLGIGTTTPITKLEVSGGLRISMESATCAVSYAGTLRYNAGNVEFCNGTTWAAFGVSSSGLTSLNGSTSQTQTFANGASGNAPSFVTANGVHTLNIPLASATGSVTAGLISNADYVNFSNKITSSAAAIAQVLGYTPASATALGNYLVKSNNLSDLTSSATARTNLGLGTFATANTLDLGSASATGTLAVARLPSFSGDATSTSGSNVLTLADTGVTASTYTKVTVDTKGRVTSGTQLSASDVTTALGYTPANSATNVSSQWNTSGTTINYNAGNVGIGTANPNSALEINKTDPIVRIKNSGGDLGGMYLMNSVNAGWLGMYNPTGSAFGVVPASTTRAYLAWDSLGKIGTVTNSFTTGNPGAPSYRTVIDDGSGNMGVGSGTPGSRLVVKGAGTTSATSALNVTDSSNSSLLFVGNDGSVGVGTATPGANLEVYGDRLRLTDTSNAHLQIANTTSNMWTLRANTAGGFDINQSGYDGSAYGTSSTARMTISSSGSIGIGRTPVTTLDVSGGVRISMESATCAVAYAGTLRYNAGNIEFCNGTTWAAFGVSTSGLTSLNGSASQTQTFAIGISGNSPAFATANGVHTLNIPLASATGSVTAGLISNADYVNFSNKITSSAASIAQVLGYTPASATALGSYVLKSNNLSDLTNVATARTNLGLGAFATMSSLDLGSVSATGTLATARLPAFAGDVSSTAGSNSLTVAGLRGVAVSATPPVSGQVLTYNGSTWTPAAAGSSSQWTTSGTAISYSTGNVGIGTSAPATTLDVNGAATFRQAYFEKVGALGVLGCGSTNITGYSTNLYTLTACSGTTTLNIPTVTGWPSGSMSWTVTFFVTAQTGSTFNVSYNGGTANVFWDKNSTGGAGGASYSGFLINNGATNVFTCTVLNTGSVAVYCGVSAQY